MENNSSISGPIRKSSDIILIGMPGCGKTTAGELLAGLTGRELLDTDRMIVRASGMPVPQLFAQKGEIYFRALESEMLALACRGTGKIIATGGGVVTVPGNIEIMRQAGTVYYIERPLEELATEERPLSSGGITGLRELYTVRQPLYLAAAHYVIQFTSYESCAREIFRRQNQS